MWRMNTQLKVSTSKAQNLTRWYCRKKWVIGNTNVRLPPLDTICPDLHLEFAHHRKFGSDSIALIEIISSYLHFRKKNGTETVYKPLYPQFQYPTFWEVNDNVLQDNGRSNSVSLGFEHTGMPKCRKCRWYDFPSALFSETLIGAYHQDISRKTIRLAVVGRRRGLHLLSHKSQ